MYIHEPEFYNTKVPAVLFTCMAHIITFYNYNLYLYIYMCTEYKLPYWREYKSHFFVPDFTFKTRGATYTWGLEIPSLLIVTCRHVYNTL